ncbi:bifunctional diaminohydroxyphosphoribosylaminopyrimidine deaminase/5-amino-6-(5-phosphoribosylamino)uracil reductase RibD [Sedimentimonas flavescens]|uniref:bifunctional diaminohydroxyphosphoribosylaminopyrimidine deaminase/5-amino-6-(5-phosphoribosylamino)uracil reductase RibD n=1 Tax=Sedimentimonas flavescens TaxID=2851012 RepID=UPI0021A65147|nr:bifunctional diaminohydroxyphosphoribosylaminopyrimidine deaminase/5-amino-6-(5-phosphoribosylamino)uracil reductase RibD [Sedimentimonas flavescens]MCT2539161.1 bifunctional diaminohydroxyphosphoribosylaminopyrimidine deaminase/5-amino-6-(5-phosphoribosylamino)uracil reductase RibD [Sedimentimonas flavescens]
MNEADTRFMRLALSLAARGLGNVWPNPAVGCVIVNQGQIVGRGWTQPGGRPHAERRALDQAGAAARGATAYVTLEPCAHHGKTPPCAEGLVAAGVARVVSAMTDPDPRVAGRGHAMLRAAGVSVDEGLLEDEARDLQAGFLSRIERGRPWVALKLASSFDGRIALANGESQWITGPEARSRVHALRAQFDAVLVGGGTARADDPLLTVRGFRPLRQPVRVVASARLDLPRGRLAGSLDQAPLWLVHGAEAPREARQFWQDLGAELIELPCGAGGLGTAPLMQALGARGLTRVFCEGGGQFAASLMRAGVVDELIGFTAGVSLGADARPALGDLGLKRLADAPRFDLVEVTRIGGDVLHRWRQR